MKRRQFIHQSSIATTLLGTLGHREALWADCNLLSEDARPKHLLSSSLFGYTELDKILPIAKRLGITSLDVWPKVHGNQREQLNEMGEEKFVELLSRHD